MNETSFLSQYQPPTNKTEGVVSLVRVCNDRYGAFVANELRGSYAADGNLWKGTRVFRPVGST